MAFVLLIGAVLVALVMEAFGGPRQRAALRGARTSVATLQARARTAAVERGTEVRLIIDAAGDSVVVVRDGVTLERLDVRERYEVDMRSDSARLALCMGPRGYAMESCTSFTTVQTIRFVLGSDSLALDILPLGQVVY